MTEKQEDTVNGSKDEPVQSNESDQVDKQEEVENVNGEAGDVKEATSKDISGEASEINSVDP